MLGELSEGLKGPSSRITRRDGEAEILLLV
jgi:hypothetical protein